MPENPEDLVEIDIAKNEKKFLIEKTIIEKQEARFILTTEKDLIKLRTIRHEICKKVYALPIQFSLSNKDYQIHIQLKCISHWHFFNHFI